MLLKIRNAVILYDASFFNDQNNTAGTAVLLRMSNHSTKKTKDVFDMFFTDDGFVKTEIPIRNICEFGYPVSRSQARRLYRRLDRFEEIILDFKDVPEIGQAFAHEIFVVFQKAHHASG